MKHPRGLMVVPEALRCPAMALCRCVDESHAQRAVGVVGGLEKLRKILGREKSPNP